MAEITVRGARVAVDSRTHARARRITLRIGAADGRILLTRPSRVPEREALAFAESRSAWIAAQLAARPEEVVVRPGAAVPVEGAPVPVVEGPRRAALIGGALCVPSAQAGPAAERVLRALAAERLDAACARHGGALGRRPTRIALRDPRGRWGSCTAAGRLMFSWRLVMAPPEVLDYVAAHEVAHLAHMHHGPAFWDEVARLSPAHEGPRGWLRAHGAGLHRYRFDLA